VKLNELESGNYLLDLLEVTIFVEEPDVMDTSPIEHFGTGSTWDVCNVGDGSISRDTLSGTNGDGVLLRMHGSDAVTSLNLTADLMAVLSLAWCSVICDG